MHITKVIEVEVGLEDFSEEDLIEELRSRGIYSEVDKELIQKLHFSFTMRDTETTTKLIRELI